MVYKVSKGGVRSGNTLRGLRSYRTRRNARQACIVGRSNLKPKEVPEFLDSHIEDELISSSLGSTDVALSLNKKKRWLLPATVGHMITTGSFNDEKTMVSLLERHKLKRRANCVSFVCNQGRVRHVVPRQKRYFSFNLDNIDNDLSIRQKKFDKAESMKQTKVPTVQDTNLEGIKVVDAYTVIGPLSRALVSSKPELRLEVFYPCPKSCSLAYNPKYTNVHMEFGEEGGMEMKQEKKVLRKGRKHRKRFSLKDLETYDPEVISSEEFWDDEDNACSDSSVLDAKSNGGYLDNNLFGQSLEKEVNEGLVGNFSKDSENANLFTSLVIQAEKAKLLCSNSKSHRERKLFNKGRENKTSAGNNQGRSHIVYINEAEARLVKKATTIESPTPTCTTTNYPTLTPARVILKSGETTPGNLRAKFGRFYAEAESEPRRFMIDVSEDVQSLVRPYRNAELSAVFTSFLVFVHDGVYDEGLDTFKVIFNSNCCPETIDFKENISFGETSLAEIMDRVARTVLVMKNENLIELNCSKHFGGITVPKINYLSNLVRADVMTYNASDEIRRVSQAEVMEENVDFSTSLDSIFRDLDCDIFCDICYESINPTQAWDVSGTRLLKCSHIFCDDCWRSHLRAKLMEGSLKMTCPGYDCDETVGPVTMLSLLHVSEVSKFFQRKCEEEADSSTNSRWCPNRDCGRVIKLDSERSTDEMLLDVTCSCGHEFCFSCLSHPHWPATCEQAEKYAEKLQTLGSLTQSTENQKSARKYRAIQEEVVKARQGVIEIDGRLCPKCSRFYQKEDQNRWCSTVYCKCGHIYCWKCLNDYTAHPRRNCAANPAVLYESTLKLRIRHIAQPTIFTPSVEVINTTQLKVPRQKATMYKRAVNERLEAQNFNYGQQIKKMGKQIASAYQKDLHLKSEILSLCGLDVDDIDTDDLIRFPLVPHMTKFLRSCWEIKRALHRVAEFTFVLLQDTADSVDKRRALRLANDLSGYCSFIRSILESGQRQDMGAAVKRLAVIQTWAKRALTTLLINVHKLRC